MDGPVLSGGVIVLVSVLLWMLYLLPSWRGRFQYNAAERNAVRLNQALRILAETSETPGEVRVELSARSALAQQKLARRVQSEREVAELEALRQELAATRAEPAVRRARARRLVRVIATSVLVGGIAVIGFGIWQVVATGAQTLIWVGGTCVVLAAVTLQRMTVVLGRATRGAPASVEQVQERVAPALHDQGSAPWTPRRLPESLVTVTGSRAQAARATIDAQDDRRRAERLAALRERAEQMAPESPVPLPRTPSPYAAMGIVDDAEIEQHVRQLLTRRAAG